MDTEERMTEVFSKMVDLGVALGRRDIAKLPGCWEEQVDAAWWFAINPHRESVQCSKGAAVPEFTAYVEFNGWPAGFINPHGGTMAAGRIANEDALIAALDKRICEAQP